MKLYRSVQTKTRGRALVAVNRVAVCEVIIREAPFALVPLPDKFYGERFEFNDEELELLHVSQRHGMKNGCITAILAARCIIASMKSKAVYTLWEQLHYMKNGDQWESSGIRETAEITLTLIKTLDAKEATKLATRISLDECLIALKKLSCNAFRVVDDYSNEAAIAVYSQSSAINHSCSPNALQRFTKNGEIIISAMRVIQPNEEILISYIDSALPTWYRQRSLRSYGFSCSCLKCMATERWEAYRCPSCKYRGLLYPVSQRGDELQLYRDWLRGTVRFNDSSHEGSKPIHPILSTQLALPCLPWILSTTSNTSFQCNLCNQIVAISLVSSLVNKLIKAYFEALQYMSHSKNWKIAEAELFLDNSWKLIEYCDSLLPSRHHSYQHCESILLEAIEWFVSQQAIPKKLYQYERNRRTSGYNKRLELLMLYEHRYKAYVEHRNEVYAGLFYITVPDRITLWEVEVNSLIEAMDSGEKNYARYWIDELQSHLEGSSMFIDSLTALCGRDDPWLARVFEVIAQARHLFQRYHDS